MAAAAAWLVAAGAAQAAAGAATAAGAAAAAAHAAHAAAGGAIRSIGYIGSYVAELGALIDVAAAAAAGQPPSEWAPVKLSCTRKAFEALRGKPFVWRKGEHILQLTRENLLNGSLHIVMCASAAAAAGSSQRVAASSQQQCQHWGED